jgi:lactoylglutathione lyase
MTIFQLKNLKATAFKIVIALFLFAAPAVTRAQTVFNHVAICAKDLKKSTEFYTSVLKLKVIPNPFKDTVHTWYSIAPDIQMHAIQGNCSPAEHIRGDHLCFSVPSVTAFIARLNELKIPYCNWKGVTGQVEHRVDGVTQAYFQDPDGYWIEINDAK